MGFFAVIFLMSFCFSEADVIHFKSGGSMECEIIKNEEQDDYIEVRLKMGGIQKIKRELISTIEKSDLTLSPSEEYRRRKQSVPGSAQNCYELAIYCMEHSLYDEAKEELAACIMLDPEYKNLVEEKIREIEAEQKSYLYNRAEFLYKTGQYQSALAYIRRILQLYPNDSIAQKAKELEAKIGSRKSKKDILNALKASRDRGDFSETILLLGIDKDPLGLEVLIELLNDRETKIKLVAIEALVLRNDKEALLPLRRKVTMEEPKVKEKAVWALGELHDEGAVEILIPLLGARTNTPLRELTAGALGKIGSDKAVPALIKALADESSSVRAQVTQALSEIGDKRATRALISALAKEDLEGRINIYRALGRIGDSLAIEPLMKEITHEKVKGQMQIVSTLGEIGSEEALDKLTLLLRSFDRETLLEKVMTTLKGFNSEKVVPAIATCLRYPSERIRQEACSILSSLKNSEAIPFLRDALKDSSETVRLEAARAIIQIQGK